MNPETKNRLPTQKEKYIAILCGAGILMLPFAEPVLLAIIFFPFFLFYGGKIFVFKESPKHKDWPYAIMLMFAIQSLMLLVGLLSLI